jgi:hypothetical protein
MQMAGSSIPRSHIMNAEWSSRGGCHLKTSRQDSNHGSALTSHQKAGSCSCLPASHVQTAVGLAVGVMRCTCRSHLLPSPSATLPSSEPWGSPPTPGDINLLHCLAVTCRYGGAMLCLQLPCCCHIAAINKVLMSCRACLTAMVLFKEQHTLPCLL